MNIIMNFVSKGVRNLLKDIDFRVATISLHYWMPFLRDLAMAVGMIQFQTTTVSLTLSKGGIDASREAIVNALQKQLSVMIIIGGAAEGDLNLLTLINSY